ncbi:2-oxo-3-hexenedioate decarboxylase [Neomegalonema sp.]|uniref:2-oxo-3-hexenedioate decarboxylase n=1 Tax=Neomegalonema sp. TaxID=2039713 RepID=UPI00261E2F0D|nr:2-oxo-3-hexenedioate decarboxylase [Neomegalonema sp.]MDD2869772.1 2-oxo-3-hexenedioate decarboxylase [Neomegalonema sp.]
MSLDAEAVARLSERVETAQTCARAIRKLTDDHPGMTVADAYRVQTALRRSYERRGQRVVGWKAGLTSRPKMIQMGVDKPGVGFLTEAMARPEGSAITVSDLIHPRVECELAFVTKAELSGKVSRAEVMAATDYVQPALEIIDSRFTGFKFDLESVLADNSSSARFVLGGRPRRPEALDLRTIGVVMEIDGEIVALGASAEVLGHPAEAVAMLVGVLHDMGETLPAGSLVLSGAITQAVPVKVGNCVAARFFEMGSVGARFVA